MTRRVGWYFTFIGIILLTIALILAMGRQSGGWVLVSGLAALIIGVWIMFRSAGVAPAPPPPPPAPAAAPKGGKAAPAKPENKPEQSAPPAKPAKPRSLGGLFSRSK